MKVEFNARFNIPLVIEVDRPTEVFIDTFTFKPIPYKGVRIIILEEPLRDLNLIDYVKRYSHLYNYVLTFQDDILRDNPKSIHFRNADIWVTRGYDPQPRRYAVSTLVGGKRDLRMPGYALRHDLWKNKDRIVTPKEFYLSDSFKWDEVDYTSNTILYGSKDKMFDVMFHVAIENCSIKHYYSEKLLDCIESKTVPIYYGCQNIGDYFNKEGIISVGSVGEIVDACNNLTEDLYTRMLPAMEENKERIKGRPDFWGQLENILKQILK